MTHHISDLHYLASRVNDDSLVGGEEFAEHALKQSALNRQLLDLNKVLAQKEELAKAMASSDEKFQVRLTLWLTSIHNSSSVIF